MRRASVKQIDSEKLRHLVEQKGTLSRISVILGYSPSAIAHALYNGTVSVTMANLLDNMYGIKYEDYKPTPKEPDPEPKQEETPSQETALTNKQEQYLRAILNTLTLLNNNMIAMGELLQKIDLDIRRLECD